MIYRVAVWLLVAVLPMCAGQWPRYSSSVKLELRIPEAHPYLALTPELIQAARQRAATSAIAKEQMDRVLTQAAGLIAKPWGELPPRANEEHRAICGRLFTAGLAYAFSGEKRYAEWVRDGLLAYAALYPRLPAGRGMRLFTQSSLFEATWLVPIAQAYDLVAGSGVFTAEQARLVENDLLRPAAACFKIEDFEADPRIRNLHFRCYNFQAWHISAVGLAGLALKDQELVDWAVNSPYGLRHLVGHDINDDGMFWERAEGYHEFVISALLPFTEAMFHCGVDTYNMSVPADRRKDEDAHYVTDTSDRPKSLRMLFEPIFYLTFPDLSYPALGDSRSGPMRPAASTLVAYNRYRDARLKWLLAQAGEEPRRDWHWLVNDPPGPDRAPAAFPLQEGSFANTGEYRNGCSLLPSTGVAILRQATGDYTRQPDTTAASLSYGPHGGGHGHSDALGLVVYALGRQWIPDFGSMPYETHWKAEWTAQTISHNTVVVDGISQKPTGKRDIQWPTDSAADRVMGTLERFDPATKSVRASCDRAYERIRLRRAVRLDGHRVVDVFTAADTNGTGHQYDYVLHIDGQFEASSASLEPRDGKLGSICGYQLVDQKRRGITQGPFHLTFTNEGRQMRLWVAGAEATEAIVGEGLTASPDRKMTLLVLRRNAPRTQFVTVVEPVIASDAVQAVRIDGSMVVIESAAGTRRVPI